MTELQGWKRSRRSSMHLDDLTCALEAQFHLPRLLEECIKCPPIYKASVPARMDHISNCLVILIDLHPFFRGLRTKS